MSDYTVAAAPEPIDMNTVGGMAGRLSSLYRERGALYDAIEKMDKKIAETRAIIESSIASLNDALKSDDG